MADLFFLGFKEENSGFRHLSGLLTIVAFWCVLWGSSFQGKEGIIPISNSFIAKVSQDDLPKPNSKQNILEVFFELEKAQWVPRKGKVIVIVYHQIEKGLEMG